MAPWSFTTFSTSESTSIQPPGKPLQTLEQIIIRQLSREQRNRTRGQVPQESCGIVATSNQPKQSIAGRFKIRTYWRMKYGSHSRETNRGSLSPRTAVLHPNLKGNKCVRTRPYQVLAYRVTAGGFDLHRRDLCVDHSLAIGVVMAHWSLAQPAALPADDSRGLRDAGRVSVDCEPQPTPTLEPHLVHRVVHRCTRCNHGSPGAGKRGPNCTPLGRRSGTAYCRGLPSISHPARHDSNRCCHRQKINT